MFIRYYWPIRTLRSLNFINLSHREIGYIQFLLNANLFIAFEAVSKNENWFASLLCLTYFSMSCAIH